MNKEHNFVSAVVYISDDVQQTISFFDTLNRVMDEHFLHYEFVAVNGDRCAESVEALRKWSEGLSKPLTVVNMSLLQGHEQCMNAGIDIAIGDYVYEFDSTSMPYAPDVIWKAYETAMQGNDIVNVCPEKEKITSKLFYAIFNRYSYAPDRLRTDAFRVVSRRAINRVHAISENMPYRKAAYAASGLKMMNIEFGGAVYVKRSERSSLAINSLVLYTDFGFKFSIRLAVLMGCITLGVFIYALFEKIGGVPVEGWTSLVCITSFGLSGLFFILAMAIKYLALLLQVTFKKQSYQIEGIEKL